MDKERHDNRFWFGFFIGGLLGAILLFFMGTKEGKKTGKLLEDKGRDLLDELEEKLEEMEKRGKELVKQGEELKEQVVSEIKEKKEDLGDAAAEKLDTALAHIEKLQEQSVETTKHIRQRFFKNTPKRR
ncbi:YtxH domain-containing protein [Candidatus Gottesmanbacteria bacterium]|nr:YtxH domain-containing protein [Candidatus Gottesmanbacteria bacterium]MBI3559720.1 YtxH domain-containing protein [Candidatus Gottesmanbacteria bacterium]